MSNGRTREQMSEDMKAYWRRRKARDMTIEQLCEGMLPVKGWYGFRIADGQPED